MLETTESCIAHSPFRRPTCLNRDAKVVPIAIPQ